MDFVFDSNLFYGFVIINGVGKIDYWNIIVVLNMYSGVWIYDGKVLFNFRFLNLFSNREDGCCILN